MATTFIVYRMTKEMFHRFDHFIWVEKCLRYRGMKLEENIFKKILSLDIEYFEERQTSYMMTQMDKVKKIDRLIDEFERVAF